MSINITQLYVPTVWVHLKTYCDQNINITDNYHWVDPLFQRLRDSQDVANWLKFKQYDPKDFDVMCFSVYTWNWNAHLAIAEDMKRQNPNALCIFGGPQISWQDEDIFKKYPFIDIIVKGEGEESVADILQQRLIDNNYSAIPGLFINDNGTRIDTGQHRIFWETSNTPSPWLSQEDRLNDMLASEVEYRLAEDGIQLRRPWIVYETNKGCPYRCTFCDWGQVTDQKIRKINMDRVKAEIDWMQRTEIRGVYVGDANFGVFDRDIQIAQWFADAKQNSGFPSRLYLNSAKNTHPRRVEIIKILRSADVLPFSHVLDLQTTDEFTLQSIRRRQGSFNDYKVLAKQIRQESTKSIIVSLIVGCPGETNTSWEKSVTDIFELTAHSGALIHPWLQFPNSPAADPEYVAEWQIKTINRPSRVLNLSIAEATEWQQTVDVMVANKDMTEDDWVMRLLFFAFCVGIHSHNNYKPLGFLLRHSYDVSYLDIYKPLFELFLRSEHTKEIVENITAHYQAYLTDEYAPFGMPIPDYKYYLVPDVWMFMQLQDINLDAFIQESSTELWKDIVPKAIWVPFDPRPERSIELRLGRIL